jgi:hypothetical protein
MKRVILFSVLLLFIALLVLAVGYLLGSKNRGPKPEWMAVEPQSVVSVHTVVKEVLPVGEFASLAYHYTSVVKNVNSKDINGWNIPFTTRKYIFTYDGTMKLGIDCGKIQVEANPPVEEIAAESQTAEDNVPAGTGAEGNAPAETLEIVEGPKPGEIWVSLPPIKILSHEVFEDTIEVYDQSQTIFNEIKIEEAFRVTGERKREMEVKVQTTGTAIEEARASLELQFGKLLQELPGIKDIYTIVFVWRTLE